MSMIRSLIALLVLAAGVTSRIGQRQTVSLDLRHGIVKGYSDYIAFLTTPQPSNTLRCDAQAVVRIDFSGIYNRARFVLEYERPRLWTVDISDSQYGDGNGGDNGTTSNMAETQIFNRQLRIHGNNLPGYLDATIDGGFLLKVVDNIVRGGKKVTLDISDEKIEWSTGKRERQSMKSAFLFTLSGQSTLYGETDYNVYAGFNRVVAGNFRSGSGLCHVTIVLYEDIKKSTVGNCRHGHQCHPDAVCYNTRRAFRCQCKDGFYGTGKICQDDDECAYQNGGCVHHCLNAPGNYSCSCLNGFQLDEDRHNCIDVDECGGGGSGCDHLCVNTLGSYECQCNAGYYLQADGLTCASSSPCDRQLQCAHHCVSGGRRGNCACRAGYTLLQAGRVCQTTCAVGNGGCQHKCENTADGPVCSCDTNYVLKADNKTCVASCGVSNGGCDRRCQSTAEGPKCSCPEGFILHHDEKTCLDIDECNSGNGGCSNGCINSIGSYECICPKGYRIQGDQQTCDDVDECGQNNTCDHQCINTDGSFLCLCNHGYESYGNTHCADFNECSVNNGGCEHECVNTDGDVTCHCGDHYKLHENGKDCVEISVCQEPEAPAKAVISCSRELDENICELTCAPPAVFMLYNSTDSVTTRCGPSTGYAWSHELENDAWPSCSEHVDAPGYKRRFKFLFFADQCGKKKVRKRTLRELQQQIRPLIQEDSPRQCGNLCQVRYVEAECGARRIRIRRLPRNENKPLVSAEFELHVKPRPPSGDCDVDCARELTNRQLRRTMKVIKERINDIQDKFLIRFENRSYEIIRRSFKTTKAEDICNTGQVLLNNKCVSCSLGMSYAVVERVCVPCQKGTYQDKEGELSCKPCPHRVPGVGIIGAKSLNECTALCEPGTFSSTGRKPCGACALGTYQTDYGRTRCIPCGEGISTRQPGARGFQDCLVSSWCDAGHYYSHSDRVCQSCPLHTYQPHSGQDYCIDCPGDTMTDFIGSINSLACKDHSCGSYIAQHEGYISSPNWPGPYPANVECTWTIRPEKGRRILIVIPEIFLAAEDKCGDSLVMRKSASPYSLTTYDTCESTDTPIAFTARSRKLWIQFRTDTNNSAKGFTIPYVTYDEEYQELIDEIVRDGRLYSSYQHQEVLKDRQLLSSLLEVIAHPNNYFTYATDVHSILPASFLNLLRKKVFEFFSF